MTVADILGASRLVLLDFDGPLCKVFAGLSADTVARRLREAYASAHGPEAAALLSTDDDPLAVVRDAALRDMPHADHLEELLTALEIEAVDQATPTPHAEGALEVLRKDGLRITVVSNNSGTAVSRYVAARGLTEVVPVVIGRERGHVGRMKPAPDMLRLALERQGTSAAEAVMVGDSVTDIQAAQAAGTRSIGYANKPGKADALRDAGADAIIKDMAELSITVRQR
ncbi:HAD family hydrolase [Streptomyces mangrovi]|uniref:HAD family hydrolase n=1 Tax=Streptomyces mangrovi TaxID=1206892 RepID=UPI00399D2856